MTKDEKSFQCPELPTCVDILGWRAFHQPEKLAYTYLVDGETQETNLTYQELDMQARSVAAMLPSTLKQGQCALLLYPPGLDFIAAFMGCLYAGVVAIPAYPPRDNRNLSRLTAIAADAQATVGLTTRSVMTDIQRKVIEDHPLTSLQLLPTDELSSVMARQWRKPSIESDSLAFIQYTSGSTGNAKGVMVSHGNVLHNLQVIKEFFGHSHRSIGVGWLPLFHDMGLIGNMLQPLYLGIPIVLMSSAAFIQKPFRWLHAISRYQATTSGGPNFAYDLCVEKITAGQKAQLDLSRWDVAFNGAEPVHAETLERFCVALASCGFRKEAFYPCYGMAEATLMITGAVKSAGPVVRQFDGPALEQDRVVAASGLQTNSRKLVGCGHTFPDQKVILVDPETCVPCPAGRVGEIWVQGPSVARGYWKNPEETERTFQACLADTKEGPWLRTGDLGFIQDGELFISGRIKDLIIVRGRNHYPQDIERTVAQSHPALRAGGGAAFSIEAGGEEKLVVVQEVQRRYIRKLEIEPVARAIRQAVSEAHDLQVYAVELLKPASIPKTSSGKIRHHACKAGFLAASLAAVGRWRQFDAGGGPPAGIHADDAAPGPEAPASQAIEAWLVHLWSLDAPDVDELTLSGLDRAQLLGCASVLHAVQALAESPDGPLPRLWLVIRGAVAAGDDHGALAVAQSPLWGLGKVISLEHPDLWGGLVDLCRQAPSDEVARLAAEIRDPQGEEQIAFRVTERHVARLVHGTPASARKIALHPGGTYLITGGLGVLGLRSAQWLAGQGARHLVLLGRRGASEASQKMVGQLTQAGATIAIEQADVCDPKQMARVFEKIAASGFALRGVMHAAGVPGYQPLSDMPLDAFSAVLQPKVTGGWVLHQLTRNMALDFFICFSSIASVWGSAGQAHYAAANHFLDMLVHYRRAQGLSGLSINWGPWSGGGMTTAEAQMWLSRMGVSPLSPEDAAGALGHLLGATGVQPVVAKVDWTVFKGLYEARKTRLFLERIEVRAQADAKAALPARQTDLLQQLEAAPAGERKNLLSGYLQSEVARIMGFDPSQPPGLDQGFFEMGMDSLMAMEFKERLEAGLGACLPVLIAFDCPTIKHLADYLALEVLQWEPTGAALKIIKSEADDTSIEQSKTEPIAIIGMGCRFPGGDTPEGFWQSLLSGADAVGQVPSSRWEVDAFDHLQPDAPEKISMREGAFLDRVDQFDPQFFGISPKEAMHMDPQHRLLLEVGWEALENAGQHRDWSGRSVSNPGCGRLGLTASHPAYVICTSGSTGNPKGVVVEHRGLVNYALAAAKLFGLSGNDIVLQQISSQKLQLWETFGPEHTRLINTYGPTEATVSCSAEYVHYAPGKPIVSIGRPLTNTRMYILNPYRQPVPIGVVGELYIGGIQVARGYLNRSGQTAEHFLPDPFVEPTAREPNPRMYKTGDLGRFLPDGTIELLGRNDFQVKIRGFRIEQGEIESRLAEIEGVKEAVVLAREDSPGDKRLTAYYTGSRELSAESVRTHLSSVLPGSMVPSAYVHLKALPLTLNGKLDRKVLPAPEGDAFGTCAYEAPQGEAEQSLAAIWAELLQVEKIGRRDHFFELGGHSLTAVTLISRIRTQLGVELPLADIFAHTTLNELATRIGSAARCALPAITAADRTEALPLSFAQQRLWFLDQLEENAGRAYHMPGGIKLKGVLDTAALKAALDRIVWRHEVLRTTFTQQDGVPQQVIAPAESGFLLLEHDLEGRSESEIERLVAEEDTPFDLTKGPLIRGRLIRLCDTAHILLVTMHHIVSDGWSTGVLISELAVLYQAFSKGQDDPLPPLAIQYADYALWQRKWLEGDVLQDQLAFWTKQLEGAPALLELPADHPRPAVQDYQGAAVEFVIDDQLTKDLKALSRRHGITLFMTLLAGWAALLSRLSHQNDIVIGTPVANRTRSEIEPLIGFFVNTLALRVDLVGRPSVSELLARVKQLTIEAQSHQEIPFELVQILGRAERQQVLYGWNKIETVYPDNQCLHERFEKQVEKMPDAIAIEFEGRKLSYRQLNERSNQLARCLRKRGVGRGSIVAVMLNRSIETVIAILGILKAGGAYLPVDAHNPGNRLLSLLDDSQTELLLTESVLVKETPFAKLKNLHDMGEHAVITKKREPIADLNALPFPDRTLVDYRKYNDYIGEGCVKNAISIMASRGCPFRCLYCHKIWAKKQVVRSAANIFQEVLFYYQRGYRTFNILDDIFNLDRKNSEAFFTLVIKNKLQIRLLFPNGLRGDLLTPDYIDLMAEAGVIQMALALETASARLQKMLRKNLDIEKLRDNLLYICKNHPGLIVDLFTMFGFPTETEKEAMLTFDFIRSIKWLHFPLLHALKIYPGTEMVHFAMQNGVTKEAIERSADKATHELGETLPFSTGFARQYKADYLSNYFLNKERLEYVIPLQKRVLTHAEITAKYNSYLPGGLANYPEVAALIGDKGFFSDKRSIAEVNEGFSSAISLKSEAGKAPLPDRSRLRILLLDLSQHFSDDLHRLDDMVEAPLGLMYLLTYLNRQFGDKIHGKIAKSMIDFDSFRQLRGFLDDFGPQVIGIRTLSLYKNFFHKTVGLIKQWFPDVPIITGGPYASSEPATILSDSNIDVVVQGEGEVTLSELIGKIIEAEGRLPDDEVLGGIAGISFIPRHPKEKNEATSSARQILCMDEFGADLALTDNKNLAKVNHARDLAYVIYTSGSTGRPKGVMVEHVNVMRLFGATNQWFHFNKDDVWTLFHSCAFDFSVWEIWGALLHGGRLVVVPQLTTRSPDEFYRLLCREKVTVLNQTPSAFWQLIAAQAEQASADSHRLRLVIFGGEALETASLKPWYARNDSAATRLVNMYGITETTVHVTCRPLAFDDTQYRGASPIGARIPDLRIYMLDPHHQPVPVGVAGELYVGGAGVARGYLNRPELTAQRFLPDPFAKAARQEPDPRMYRTGDLGRYLPDGHIEYLGRNDFQVKIRGYRIELGEIEARLCEIKGVKEAVVLVAQDATGTKRLIAYYTGSDELGAQTLRSRLSGALPEYMLPAAYVHLDALPLTVNGKLDRKALTAPEGDAYGARAYEAPQGEAEQTLAAIWSALLQVEKIGRRDHFFELGGHSLLAITLISRMRKEGLHGDVRTLFAAPILADLAAAVSGQPQPPHIDVPPNLIPADCRHITPELLPLVELTQADIDRIVQSVPGGTANIADIYPLSPLQEGLLFHHLMTEEGDVYLIPTVLAFDTRKRLEGFIDALQRVIDRHDILRTVVLWEELSEPVQVVWKSAPLSMEEIVLNGDHAGDALLDHMDPRRNRIDVRKAPLMRAYMAEDKKEGRWILGLLNHHLIDDNTTLQFVAEEVRAHLAGEQEMLPKPISYRNFVSQARLGVSRKEHEEFFSQMLATVDEPTAAFGLMDVRQDGSGITEAKMLLDAPLCLRLHESVRKMGVSVASLCHLAWAQVLSLLSGRIDVVFGTVLFGRMQGAEGIERALGMFINTLPVRIAIGDEPVEQAVRTTHTLLARLLHHEHAPLSLAQRCSNVSPPAPLFTALLNYRHIRDEKGSQAGETAWDWMSSIACPPS